MYPGIINLVAIFYLYLANQISGRQLVSEVDRLVSANLIEGLPDDCMDDFDDLHEKMSLCVWDKHTYDESPDLYVSEDELRESVKGFIDRRGEVLAELVCKK